MRIRLLIVLQSICLLLLAALLSLTFISAHSLRPLGGSQAAVAQGPITLPPRQDGGATATTAPTQAQVDDAVARLLASSKANFKSAKEDYKAAEDQHKAVLDKLIVLVGGYSVLIGFTAFFSLKSAREEAQSQIALSGTQLTNHLTSTNAQLGLLKEQAEQQLKQIREEMNELKDHIWSDVPDMRAMQDGLRSLLSELHTNIPSDTDWNDENSYKNLREQAKQDILICEATIAALPALVSRQSPQNISSLERLYRAIARFYFARYKAEGNRTDSARAHAYLDRSLRLDSEDGASYGLRGAIFLAEQRLNPGTSGDPQILREQAKSNLRIAIAKDRNDLGAHYNLALALTRGNKPEELNEALDLVRGAMGRLPSFPEIQQRKCLYALVVNQACDLLTLAKAQSDPQRSLQLQDEAVQTILEGIKALSAFRERDPLDALYSLLEKELNVGGDLYGLEPARRMKLEQLLPGYRA